jgi:diguanylate cyclase (GGDEF)-like protein
MASMLSIQCLLVFAPYAMGSFLVYCLSAKLSGLLLLVNPDSLFRFGGDEFAIILPDYSCEEALHLSQKICNIAREKLAPLQHPHCGDKHCMGPAKISVSIGISLYEQNMNVESLLRSVEQKMWDAKLAGKDRACI